MRDVWGNIKCTNICIIWVSDVEVRKEQITYLMT